MRALSLMSARQATACPPSLAMASTVSRAPASLRSTTATRAPSRASASAMPRPSPLAPPVTIATLSGSRMVTSGSLEDVRQLAPHPLARGLGGLGAIAHRRALAPAADELRRVERGAGHARQPPVARGAIVHVRQTRDRAAHAVEAVMGPRIHRDDHVLTGRPQRGGQPLAGARVRPVIRGADMDAHRRGELRQLRIVHVAARIEGPEPAEAGATAFEVDLARPAGRRAQRGAPAMREAHEADARGVHAGMAPED